MINVTLILLIVGVPLLIIFYKKGYYEGMIIAQVLMLYFFQWYFIQARTGGNGWVSQYDEIIETRPEYSIRWVLPTFIYWLTDLLKINHTWLTWLFISCTLWFLGLVFFNRLLQNIGFNRKYALIGTLIPLATYGFVNRILITPDCLNFLIVMGMMWATYQLRYYNSKRLLFLLPVVILLASLIEFPIPPLGGWSNRITYLAQDFTELIISLGVWGVFIGVTLTSKNLRSKLPDFSKMSFYFLPFYILVFAVAVDWDRWFVLASFIWVPIALIGIKKVWEEINND